jgi:hypothetical protein
VPGRIGLRFLTASIGLSNTLSALVHRCHRGGCRPGDVSHSCM